MTRRISIVLVVVGFWWAPVSGQVPQPIDGQQPVPDDGNGILFRVVPSPTSEPAEPIGPTRPAEQLPPSPEEIVPPAPTEGILGKPIDDVTTRTRPPSGELPEVLPAVTPGLDSTGPDPQTGCRPWRPRLYHWQAPDACHLPLYFEDANLERHGYVPRPLRLVQPVVSGARFCATVPALPYLMAARPPCQRVYPLGEYRPGSCVPYRWRYVPFRPMPAGIEAAAITGMILIVP